jgi:hypothetical protein
MLKKIIKIIKGLAKSTFYMMQIICFYFRKDRKSQTYVNEIFTTGSASNTSGNFNVDSGVENVYSRLDDNVREDKTTYESLSP